jgi:autotransporter-associated beta strand protein
MSAALLGLLLLRAAATSRAASGSWAVAASANWSVAADWANNTVADGAGNTATFNLLSMSSAPTVTLDTSRTIGNLVFGNSTAANGAIWTIGGNSILTLDNSGSTSTITCWPLLAAGNSAATISAPLGGTLGFTKRGTGALWLGGNNSGLSGTCIIAAGCVYNYNALGLGTMNVSIASGSFLAFWIGGSFSQNLTLNGVGASQDQVRKNTLYADSTLTGSGGSFSINGTVTLNATSDIGGSSPGQIITLNGPVTGAGGLIAAGLATLTLNGANTYAGGTTLSSGQLNINNGGTSSATCAIGTGTLTISGGIIDNTSAADVVLLPNPPQHWNGDFTYLGSLHNLDLGTGSVALGGKRRVTVSAHELAVGGVIGDGGSGYGLVKAGAGKLSLNGLNTYSGGTTINAGTLALGSSGSLSNTLSLTIGAGATLDVSAVNTYAFNSRTMLSANGTGTQSGSTAAAIKGALGGTVDLAACPVVISYDGLHPALYISQGTLSLNGNAFVVNSSSPLGVGTYTIIQQAGGDVIGAGSFSVTGTAVGPGMSGLISVSGGKVNLAVQKEVTDLTVSFARTNAVVTYRAAPGSQNYFWNGLMYVVQRATNLNANAVWISISTNTLSSDQLVQITDHFADLGGRPSAQAYYRVWAGLQAKQQILAAPPAASIEQPFNFDLSAGPHFTAAQKTAQLAAGALVVPLVQQAFHIGASSIRIPPGDYRFGQETWGPNGVIYPLQFSGLQRDSQHPFTIDASGATFWFDLSDDQSPTEHFCVGFVNCSHVIFCGATVDRSTRGNVEGCITNFDFAGNRIEIALSPGCTLPTNFNGGLEQRLLPFKADGTFCAPLYALQAGGTRLKYLSLTPSADPGCCWVNLATPDLLQTITNSNWQIAFGMQGTLAVGDGLSCVYTVSAAIELVNSANVTMYGVNSFAAKALGAEWYGAGNHLWKDCYFGPRPGTSRWQGGEGYLFSGTGQGPTLDHVTILHTTDDMANFHGYWSEVIAAAGNQLTFTNHGGNSHLLPPNAVVGNTIVFYNRNSGALLGQGNVVALTLNSATLNVSATNFVSAIARWPEHECAGWVIQNCYWHDNYQRVLMQSGPGLIQNCTFARNGSNFELNFDFPYIEGGIPNGIVIANNSCTNVSPTPGQATIGYHEHTYGTLTSRLISNLTIDGNTITSPGEAGIELLGVNGGTIAGNTIVDPIRDTALAQPGQSHLQQAIFLSNCANISVLTNNVGDVGHFTVPSPLTRSHILGIDAQCQNITNRDGTLLQ